jgi:hypothetical protein
MQTIAWTTFFALQINVDEVLSKYLSRLEIDAPRAPTWSQDALSRSGKFVKDHEALLREMVITAFYKPA